MILRYGNDDLVLLESTGKLGVGLCSWNSFVRNKWQNLYKKYFIFTTKFVNVNIIFRMIFRQLILPRTDPLIEKLEKFVKVRNNPKTKNIIWKFVDRYWEKI